MHSVSRFVGIAVRAASLGGMRVRPATDELCRVCLQAPATTDGTNEPSWAHKYAGSDITAGHMGVSIAGAGRPDLAAVVARKISGITTLFVPRFVPPALRPRDQATNPRKPAKINDLERQSDAQYRH